MKNKMPEKKICPVCEKTFYRCGRQATHWRTIKYCSNVCCLTALGKNPNQDNFELFKKKVLFKDNESCWPWLANTDKKGYGRFHVDGKPILAHRYSWEHYKSKIKDGLIVRHLCDNPSCVNPNHLALGTIKDNAKDAKDSGRLKYNGGQKSVQKKLLSREIALMKICEKYGVPRKEILEVYYPISRMTITRAINGTTKR